MTTAAQGIDQTIALTTGDKKVLSALFQNCSFTGDVRLYGVGKPFDNMFDVKSMDAFRKAAEKFAADCGPEKVTLLDETKPGIVEFSTAMGTLKLTVQQDQRSWTFAFAYEDRSAALSMLKSITQRVGPNFMVAYPLNPGTRKLTAIKLTKAIQLLSEL